MNEIHLSVITVTYNNFLELKETISSFLVQKESCLSELIIIDGGSNDGTKAYMESLNNNHIKWISEKDSGIYNAMNKGIKLALGEWIIFMNSGDCFYDESVLVNIFNNMNTSNTDLYYGNCEITYDMNYSREMIPLPLEFLWQGLSFSHQSVIVKTKLLKDVGFNENYKYCADFNFIFNLYKQGKRFNHLPFKISRIKAGGVSDQKRYKSTYEIYKINKNYNSSFKRQLYFFLKIIQGFTIVNLKAYIPKSWLRLLIKLKYNN